MANVSVSLPSDGDTIDVADYNTPITTIVNDYNGNIDNSNIAAAAAIAGSKLADGAIPFGKLATGATNLGFNLNAGSGVGTLTTSYVTYATKTVSSTGGRVQIEWGVVAYNGNSGANRTLDVKLICDSVEVDSITDLWLMYVSGQNPRFVNNFTFEHTPSAGSHTYELQFKASANTSVLLLDNFINISEVK